MPRATRNSSRLWRRTSRRIAASSPARASPTSAASARPSSAARVRGGPPRSLLSSHGALTHGRTAPRRRIASTDGKAASATAGRSPVRHRVRGVRAGIADHQPPDHSRVLVGNAVVVIDPGNGQRDLEGVPRHQIVRGPWRRSRRDAQRAAVVRRVVGGRRVHVALLPVDPADGLPRRDPEARRANQTCAPSPRPCMTISSTAAARTRARGGEQRGGAGQQGPPRQRHCATRVSSATCQSTTWACGFSTPGCPALK